jgi:2,4-dienoyl-CoA reductase-like NADH-dependent reductase (Old Yellow Enzyme family)
LRETATARQYFFIDASMAYPRVSSLKTIEDFRAHVSGLGIPLDADATLETGANSPLAAPLHYTTHRPRVIGNRFCILPMEGWDGELDGAASELTRRRWRNFGLSGAKFIWGGEAVAVRHDGRANPNQLLLTAKHLGSIEQLRCDLATTHEERFGSTDDLLIGLQLTHSGRFARPNPDRRPEPRPIYRHPYLDERSNVGDDSQVLSDDDLKQLADDFVTAAKLAQKAGFEFVDVKHCHGYLGHETLSAYHRRGEFGGSFANRTRFMRLIIEGIQSEAPTLDIGVRISVFDFAPFGSVSSPVGESLGAGSYEYAFGGDGTGVGYDLAEPIQLLQLLQSMGIRLICTTAGSPYYNPHIQRPAIFPPSDGYQPPEDPLVGVARQIAATGELKRLFPDLVIVGSGYSYLQEWLPNVGQRAIQDGLVDSVGLGRMVLSYPELPADVLAGKPLARKKICRTFSDCTTAPRNGIVSGCFPLDPYYKNMPEREQLNAAKRDQDPNT